MSAYSSATKYPVLFLILLLCTCSSVVAQPQLDSAKVRNKKPLRLSLKPDAFKIGTDLTYLGQGVISAPFGEADLFTNMSRFYGNIFKGEITGDLSFNNNKYFLVLDAGYSNINRVLNSRLNGFEYRNQGFYFRAGADYNLAHKIFNSDAILLGVRFGQAYFAHEMPRYFAVSTPWGYFNAIDPENNRLPFTGSIPQESLVATWGEVNTGLRVNVWRGLILGYTFRVKLPFAVQGQTRLLANEIPGYGKTDSGVRLGFNYYAYYRFSFRKGP